MTITAAALQKKVSDTKQKWIKDAEKWAKKTLPKIEKYLIRAAEDGYSEYTIYDQTLLVGINPMNAPFKAVALGNLLGKGFSVNVVSQDNYLSVSWADSPF